MKNIVRGLVAILVLTVSLQSRAQEQKNEAGVFISFAAFDETTLLDGEDVQLEFEDESGAGVSYTRFWLPQVATELALHRLNGDVQVTGPAGTVATGEVGFDVWSGMLQWHFMRESRVSPYAGAGVGFITNAAFAPVVEDEEGDIGFDSVTTWIANAGVNVRVTERIVVTGDFRYIPYEATERDDDSGEAVDVNPLVLSAGIRFRF